MRWQGPPVVQVLSLTVLVSACSLTDIAGGPQEQRLAAEQAVAEVAKARLTDLPAETVATCVVDNASKDEITVLAEGAARGISGRLSEYVVTMTRRPEIRTCIADEVAQSLG